MKVTRNATCLVFALISMVGFSGAIAQDRVIRNNNGENRVVNPIRKIAKPMFYIGGVKPQKLAGTIELIPDKMPKVTLAATVANRGEKAESVAIGSRGQKGAARGFKKGEAATLAVAPKTMVTGSASSAQMVRVDLVLTANGQPLGHRIGDVDVKVVLPAGVPGLIRSSMPLRPSGKVNGRVAYQLAAKNAYLSELTLVYTTGPVTLEMTKTLEPGTIDKAGPVKVTLKIKNIGKGTAKNVTIEDSFDPRDFSAEGGGFKNYNGEANDQRLTWTQSIASLKAGASTTISYTVNARLAVRHTRLNAAMATIGGKLVGVSNKVKLSGKK
jgi:hypothetical protein